MTDLVLGPTPNLRRKFRRPPTTLIVGGSIIGFIVLLAIFAPLVTSYNPTTINLLTPLQSPSAAHWLGTDQLGRDIWTRLVYGARTDLTVAFIAVLTPFAVGTVLGAIAGYLGGWLDNLIMRIADVVVAFPFYVLVIVLVFLLGPGTSSIYIAISVVSWISYARIIRGSTLVAKNQEYVLAAQLQGFSTLRIIMRHILPNVISQAIVFAMSDIVNDILAIVTLGYLGLGIPPPAPDWGEMMASGQQFLTTHWELSTIPGFAVVLTGLGLSLFGDGLNELLGRN
ncbi:MAG: ABC transporter permease [Acidimicrobiales bacterium]|jgi:peptide/nickel transport system permease protein